MSREETAEAFGNVQRQIGFCGIWCGSCIVGNGVLAELTRRYEKLLKGYGLEKWAAQDFDYKEFQKGLDSIQNIPVCSGCLKAGGRDKCELRTCCLKKKLKGCQECGEQKSCQYAETLNHMRSGALEAGLFVNIENVDGLKLIENWTAELKRKWPGLILFAEYG